MSRTPSCPTRLPPPMRISHLRTTSAVPCAVGCSRPCCHPRGGHLPARGAQPPPLWSTWAPCRGRGGGCLLMARSACAAFGGCCSARTLWFPCVLLCVLLGLVSLPCVGRPCAQLFCCLRSSHCRALSFFAGMLTAVVCRSLHPIVAIGLSHSQLGGARGTGHFCTCLQIYKLTCHWCLLGLCWGECVALLLFCFLGR